jgi:hypothetical protein
MPTSQNVSFDSSLTNDVSLVGPVTVSVVKDFVAEVAKKLPTPRRLEVVGTLRKTFILHFQCVRSGYEYPITSGDWSKWLKIGFSLVKAGQAIIDVGIGNPLGILKKGIDCVSEIYSAYKTHDDDEFNAYITNPFLTSTEQDTLIEKLRAQGFFDKFEYDSQIPGWYLIHPERDGKVPEGEDGGVTHLRSKKGVGVMSHLQDMVASGLNDVGMSDAAETVSTVNMLTDEMGTRNAVAESSPVSTVSKSKATTTASRASESKLAIYGQPKVDAEEQYATKISELEMRISQLERQIDSINESRSSCCVVS